MTRHMGVLALMALCLGTGLHAQQTGQTLMSWDFEADLGGWMCPDPAGRAGRTNAADAVRSGQFSLEFNYRQRAPQMGAQTDLPGVLLCPVTKSLQDLRSVRFAVATLYSTPVAMVLLEQDGSIYLATVWSEAGRWNTCQLGLADFTLLRDFGTDENNRLDPDQVSLVGVADASLFARLMSRQGVPIYVPPETDTQMWLDDIVLSTAEPDEAGRPPLAAAPAPLVLDTGEAPTIQWAAFGGEDPSLMIEAENDRKYLRVHYSTPGGKVFILARQFQAGTLAGCKGLSMEIRAELDATIALALEQSDRSRFYCPVTVRAAAGWQRLEVPLSRFQVAPDSPAPGGQLQGERIVQIALVDLLPLTSQVISSNTWDLRDIQATR